MLRDANELDEQETIRTQVCIAGAGAAGITLARDLRDSGLDVVLLEGGGLEESPESTDLYRGHSTGIPYGDLTSCRSRYFGGSTNAWAGWCRPLDAEDFQPAVGGSRVGWPLSRADLDPYYTRAHQTCQVGPFDYDAGRMAEQLELPLLPLDPARVRTCIYRISPPTRFGDVYRADIDSAPRVQAWYHANLVEVVLDESGERVERFSCKALGTGRSFAVHATHYVLALGGIENPRILLASNAKQPGGVGNATGMVGRGFMEHPHFYHGTWMLLSGADLRFYSVHKFRTGEAEQAVILGVLALAPEARAAEDLPNFHCTVQRVPSEHFSELGLGVPQSALGRLFSASDDLELYSLTLRAEQRMVEESVVRLTEEVDALGMPRVALGWRVSETDVQGFQRGFEIIGAELGRTGLGRLWMPLNDKGRYAPAQTLGGAHHMGTTRMSASRESGVVNADARVHDCDNLYLAGSSIFPTSGAANPTLTLTALAHRLADHLRRIS